MTSKKSCKFEKAILSSAKLINKINHRKSVRRLCYDKMLLANEKFQLDSESLKHVLDTIKGNSEVK